jgi:hypothetical protein
MGMPERPSKSIAVILERTPVQNRWESERWELAGVVPDMGGDSRSILKGEGREQRFFPGVELLLYRDEAEGYYLNSSSAEPSVFVAVRQGEAGDPYPFQATLSYNEAARWMDSNEKVERALAWPELASWLAEWVAQNYRPEPKQRQRPKSYRGKEGRLREEGSS